MDDLYWKTPLKWMIWGYHYCLETSNFMVHHGSMSTEKPLMKAMMDEQGKQKQAGVTVTCVQVEGKERQKRRKEILIHSLKLT